jgi:hypothetical protein
MSRPLSVFLLLFMMFPVAWPAAAQDAEEALNAADEAAIQDVIVSQMEAFKRDDAEAAYAFAAPSIKSLFPTPEVFIRMVQRGYWPVYRPREVTFVEASFVGTRTIQQVRIVGENGQTVVAAYIMERQEDGSWRIAGCYLKPTGEVVS